MGSTTYSHQFTFETNIPSPERLVRFHTQFVQSETMVAFFQNVGHLLRVHGSRQVSDSWDLKKKKKPFETVSGLEFFR